MMDRLRNEPALVIAVVEALLVLAVQFGVDLTQEQTTAVLAVLIALGALFTRQTAYGPKSVDRIMDAERVIAAAECGEHD